MFRPWLWGVIGALTVLAVVLRVEALAVSGVGLNADEAVTGLMVRQILAGREHYVWFASQTYDGAMEQYLQAGVYEVLRLPQNPFTLRLIELAMSSACVPLMYILGRRVFVQPWKAVLAAGLYAAGPYWNIYVGTRSEGSYTSVQLIGLVGVIAALGASGYRYGAHEPIRLRALILWSGLFGLSCGLTLWQGLSGLEVLVPAGVWLLPTVIRSVRAAGAAVAGTVVGLAPVLAWVARNHRFPSLGGAQPHSTYLHRLAILFDYVAGEFFGLAGLYGHQGLPELAQRAIVSALIAAWLVAVWVRRRGLLAVITLRQDQRRPGDLIVFVLPVAVILYGFSRYAWYAGEPRYIYTLYPVALIGLAGLIGVLVDFASEHRPAARAVGRPALAALLCVGALLSSFVTYRYLGPGQRDLTTDAQLEAATTWLAKRGDTAVYADYWTAGPTDYLAAIHGSDVAVAPWGIGEGKLAQPSQKVEAAKRWVYMTSRRSADADYALILRHALREAHVRFRRVVLGGDVTIFIDLRPDLRPSQLDI